MNTKLDLMAMMAHPDDAELSCGGTLAKHAAMGYKVGIVDLTEGEMGTRGTAEERKEEAEAAGKILGLCLREQLYFQDAKFIIDEAHRIRVMQIIRKYRPEIVITNSPDDRHPDHARAAALVKEAAWFSGLKKYETSLDGEKQEAWRPKYVYHAIQFKLHKPDFVVDISGYLEQKVQAILAFKSQFYNPNATEPDTLISRPEFLETLKARNYTDGNHALIDHAEGFLSAYTPAVKDLFDMV